MLKSFKRRPRTPNSNLETPRSQNADLTESPRTIGKETKVGKNSSVAGIFSTPIASLKISPNSKPKVNTKSRGILRTSTINTTSNSKAKSDGIKKLNENDKPTGISFPDSITEQKQDFQETSNILLTRLEVPSGFLPPSFKDCLFSNVLRAARRSLEHLKEVRESLSNLVSEDEQLSKGIRKTNLTAESLQLSLVAEALTILTREAFVPTHRLNQTAIALHTAEDFFRYPKDIKAFDPTSGGRIKLPDQTFNTDSIQKLRDVVEKATEYYNKFNLRGTNGPELQDMLFTLMRAFRDLYTVMLGCQDVFKALLYTSPREKMNLQEFLMSLQSMERSDMLTEVQDLRRIIDELVIFLEKLSWGSYVVYRLASGKNVVTSETTPDNQNAVEQPNIYPDLPILQQIRVQKRKMRRILNRKPSETQNQVVEISSSISKQKMNKKKKPLKKMQNQFGSNVDATVGSLQNVGKKMKNKLKLQEEKK